MEKAELLKRVQETLKVDGEIVAACIEPGQPEEVWVKEKHADGDHSWYFAGTPADYGL